MATSASPDKEAVVESTNTSQQPSSGIEEDSDHDISNSRPNSFQSTGGAAIAASASAVECPSSKNAPNAAQKHDPMEHSSPEQNGLNNPSDSFQDVCAQLETWKQIQRRTHRKDTLVFSTRISVALTTCSLFILLDHPDPSERVYPNATWIFIICCIVLWLPPQHPLDATSITFQIIRAMVGNLVAAALSLGCGFLATLIAYDQGRATFMGCCIAVVSFLLSFVVVRFDLMSGVSAQLGLLIFCICLFPFLNDTTDKAWQPSVYYVANAWVGCVIACGSSLIIFPRSTRWSLCRRLTNQMTLVGECAQSILETTCQVSQGDVTVRHLATMLPQIRSKKSDPDASHESYAAYFFDTLDTQSLVQLLPYDVLGCCRSSDLLQAEATNLSSQAFLVVTICMILHGCIQHGGVDAMDSETIDVLVSLGNAIKVTVNPDVAPETSERAAEFLLSQIPFLRHCILQACQSRREDDASRTPALDFDTMKRMLGEQEETNPIYRGLSGNEIFLFQMIEQLVLQSLRLYYVWDLTEEVNSLQSIRKPSVEIEAVDKENVWPRADSLQVSNVTENGKSPNVENGRGCESNCAKESIENGGSVPPITSISESHDAREKTASTTNESTRRTKWKSSFVNGLRNDAVRFAIRNSVAITLSSLFVLLDSPDPSKRVYPQGEWVLVSAVVVNWYPTLDAASVVLKTLERVFGTVTAAILGWSCGLLSVAIPDDQWRAAFMGVCIAFVAFAYAFIGFASGIFTLYRYGSYVGIFTFGIVVFPFTDGELDSWWTGLYRIVNTVIGALISCICALVLFPKSTRTLTERRVTHQVEEAGLCVQKALSSCSRDHEANDDAYNSILAGYKWSNDLLFVLGVDPFMRITKGGKTSSQFRVEAALTLARAFRLEATANLFEHIAPISVSPPKAFLTLGEQVASLLSATKEDIDESDKVADDILSELFEMRTLLQETRTVVSQSIHHPLNTADLRKTLSSSTDSPLPFIPPLQVGEASENDLSELLLAEHMILRSLRLYYLWKENKVCKIVKSE